MSGAGGQAGAAAAIHLPAARLPDARAGRAEIGRLRRVSISDLIAYNADPRSPSAISGIPGHPIEDLRISNVRHDLAGGLTPGDGVYHQG